MMKIGQFNPVVLNRSNALNKPKAVLKSVLQHDTVSFLGKNSNKHDKGKTIPAAILLGAIAGSTVGVLLGALGINANGDEQFVKKHEPILEVAEEEAPLDNTEETIVEVDEDPEKLWAMISFAEDEQKTSNYFTIAEVSLDGADEEEDLWSMISFAEEENMFNNGRVAEVPLDMYYLGEPVEEEVIDDGNFLNTFNHGGVGQVPLDDPFDIVPAILDKDKK